MRGRKLNHQRHGQSRLLIISIAILILIAVVCIRISQIDHKVTEDKETVTKVDKIPMQTAEDKEHESAQSTNKDQTNNNIENNEKTSEDLNNSSKENTVSTENTEKDKKVEEILASMTTYEKVCQMIIVSPESLTGVSKVISAGNTTKQALKQYPIGGILYNTANIQNADQLTTMIRNVQNYSKTPLFIASDEEGGRVSRVMNKLKQVTLKPMLSYKDQGTKTAYNNAAIIAKEIKKYGYNLDFAPVADVLSNPNNKVIGDRAYGTDYEKTAKLVEAAVTGFNDSNMVCSLKHFPGHGDSSTDSHKGAVYINKTLKQLRKEELVPFQVGINAGADMVMIGHLIVKDIDDSPATLSKKIVTNLLRNELGYDGVIITDGLAMGAMTEYYSSSYIAEHAVKAGVDILLCPEDFKSAIDSLMNCVKNGSITEERIDESVRRILKVKVDKGIIQ